MEYYVQDLIKTYLGNEISIQEFFFFHSLDQKVNIRTCILFIIFNFYINLSSKYFNWISHQAYLMTNGFHRTFLVNQSSLKFTTRLNISIMYTL
jgi:hypothetical protein